jgi:HemY protein
VARAALDAQEFSAARTALAPYTAAPRKRVAALMAELEMAQGDEGRAREWMARALNARRDPAWTADAFVSDHWLPISPVSGRLDAFEWKDPLAGEDHGPVIEHRAEAAVPMQSAIATRDSGRMRAAASPPPLAGEGQGGGTQKDASVQAHPLPTPPPQAGEGDRARQADEAEYRFGPSPHETERAERADEKGERAEEKESRRSPFFGGGAGERRRRAAAMADESRAPRAEATPVAPPIIPLVHAPDDPGPNGDAPPDPETEAPPSEGWRRIRALFKS